MQHPYGWHELTSEEWRRLWNHLRELEKRTWDEIQVTSKKQNHNIPIQNLCKPFGTQRESLCQRGRVVP